jgi:threonine dehydratase
VSGGNFDFERLPEVKERSMKFEWKKRYFIISFPQRPWALKEFLWCLGEDDDIARFEYMKKSNKEKAPVLIWIETDKKENFETIENKMKELWFKYEDITNNEIYFDLLI